MKANILYQKNLMFCEKLRYKKMPQTFVFIEKLKCQTEIHLGIISTDNPDTYGSHWNNVFKFISLIISHCWSQFVTITFSRQKISKYSKK